MDTRYPDKLIWTSERQYDLWEARPWAIMPVVRGLGSFPVRRCRCCGTFFSSDTTPSEFRFRRSRPIGHVDPCRSRAWWVTPLPVGATAQRIKNLVRLMRVVTARILGRQMPINVLHGMAPFPIVLHRQWVANAGATWGLKRAEDAAIICRARVGVSAPRAGCR